MTSALKDLNLFGLLFESMVIRDLSVYAQGHDAGILHYRDNTGLEVDAVVETGDGRWAAFEIKLGPVHIDDGASNLLKFAGCVDTGKCGRFTYLACGRFFDMRIFGFIVSAVFLVLGAAVSHSADPPAPIRIGATLSREGKYAESSYAASWQTVPVLIREGRSANVDMRQRFKQS